MLAARSAKTRGALATLLLAAALLVTLPWQPGWWHLGNYQWMKVNLGGSTIIVDPRTADNLAMLNKLADQFAPNSGSFIAPFWPGTYAVLERKSPVWANYALVPHSAAFQKAEIARTEAAHPGFAVVVDFPLDNRDALRFRNTHP